MAFTKRFDTWYCDFTRAIKMFGRLGERTSNAPAFNRAIIHP